MNEISNCVGCKYFDAHNDRCTAFECYGIDCPSLPCEEESEEDEVSPRLQFETLYNHDFVNHPKHYNYGQIEVWDYIEDKGLNFNLGNVCKYISRAGKKSTDTRLEDLQKAKAYLDREIMLTMEGRRNGK